jgi:hypothetical protein
LKNGAERNIECWKGFWKGSARNYLPLAAIIYASAGLEIAIAAQKPPFHQGLSENTGKPL